MYPENSLYTPVKLDQNPETLREEEKGFDLSAMKQSQGMEEEDYGEEEYSSGSERGEGDNDKSRRQKKNKRRSKNDNQGRNFRCGCGKSYLSYPALYTHIKTKHQGKTPEGTNTAQFQTGRGRGRPRKLLGDIKERPQHVAHA